MVAHMSVWPPLHFVAVAILIHPRAVFGKILVDLISPKSGHTQTSLRMPTPLAASSLWTFYFGTDCARSLAGRTEPTGDCGIVLRVDSIMIRRYLYS